MKRILQWAVSSGSVSQLAVGSGSVKPRLRNTAYCVLKNSLLKTPLLNTAYCVLKNSLLKPRLRNTAYCILKTPFQNTAYCILLYCLLFFSQLTHAQIYPVQTVHTIVPPYSTKLSDYATSYDVKLRLRLILNDNNVNNRQVRLKLKIQGNGLNIQSRDIVAGAPFVYLNGGTSQAFTNVDLAAYFQLHNLIGIDARQYSRPLPDGAYKICWEVYDFQTNQLISNPDFGCDNIFLLLNDPPFLNLPNRGDQLTSTTPFINFTWTPRHANATNVSYEFELREIWETRIDPQAGFLASPNYYTQTVFSTTLVYGIGQPELFPGKTYAWRVRAISKTGLSENSVFRNDGYSEIYYFTYTQACFPPIMTLAEPLSNGRVKISWQTHPDHNKYHVQYKRADVADAEWFEVFSYNNQTQIGNLQDGVTYDFRVGGTCHSLTDLDQGYSYSTPNQFTMPTADETVSYSCGIVPEIEISNTDPVSYLGENETFRAGDFPVTVTEVEGANGTYSGTGFIVVPYLADTKIAVAFEGITINTDYQLIDGIIKTTYDPKWGGVESIDTLIEEIEDLVDILTDTIADQQEDEILSEEEAQEITEEIAEQETILEEAKEELDQLEKALEKAAKKEDKEAIAQAEEAIAKKEATVKEVKKALHNIARDLGIGDSDGTAGAGDGYFHGSFGFTDPADQLTLPDSNRTIRLVDETTRDSLFVNEAFTLDGKPYCLLVTSNTSTTEQLQEARSLSDAPEGTTLYYHYDFKENILKYRVTVSDDFFGKKLAQADVAALRELHQASLEARLKAHINAAASIDSLLIAEVLSVNRSIAAFLQDARLPECSWNPAVDCADGIFNQFAIAPKDAGIMDGILEEVTGVGLLISMVVDYKLDPVARAQIHTALDEFSVNEAFTNWAADKVEQYSGSPAEKDYQLHKDFVTVVSTFFGAGLGAATKGKKAADAVEVFADGVKRWGDEVAKGGARFIAKSGTELKTFLNGITDLPAGKTYNGNMYRSLSKSSETNFGALPDKMTDHTVYSSWGRYDLDGVENAMYLSKTVPGNQTEITHYGNWLDYNTYEFKNIQLDNLLDLSDDVVRQKLGTQFDDLVRTLGEKDDIYEMTNVLASWARQKGYNGIIAPGARGSKNYENIILFNQSYIDYAVKGITPQKIIK